MIILKTLVSVFFLSTIFVSAQGAEKIYYPRPEASVDSRNEYPVELLQLVFKKAGGVYELVPNKVVMPQLRSIKELQNNHGDIDVMWTMTSKSRESLLRPIRIPIDKGLIGGRIALVTEPNQDLFKNVTSAADLSKFSAGQGYGWPDVDILRANQIQVVDSSTYTGLFNMLSNKRFAFLPRSLDEIWPELKQYQAQGLAADQYLALHCPAASYYFVNKKNAKLAANIEKGLNLAIADGSFERLFRQYFEDGIKRADLKNRIVIELANPLMSDETPLARKELWFFPK